MGVDHDSKVAIATWLEQVWNMREESWDSEHGLYTKSWHGCVDAVVPDEDLRSLIFVLCACHWTVAVAGEAFVNKYAAVRRIDA